MPRTVVHSTPPAQADSSGRERPAPAASGCGRTADRTSKPVGTRRDRRWPARAPLPERRAPAVVRELRAELGDGAGLLRGRGRRWWSPSPPARPLDPVTAVAAGRQPTCSSRACASSSAPGFVAPTQLVFVPMLFLLPTPAVPLLVAAGSGAERGCPRSCVRRAQPRARPGRRQRQLVRGRAGAARSRSLSAAAAPSRRCVDASTCSPWRRSSRATCVASTLREWLGAGVPPVEFVHVLALVYLVDALLAPIGLLAVLASDVAPVRLSARGPAGRAAGARRPRARQADRAGARARRARAPPRPRSSSARTSASARPSPRRTTAAALERLLRDDDRRGGARRLRPAEHPRGRRGLRASASRSGPSPPARPRSRPPRGAPLVATGPWPAAVAGPPPWPSRSAARRAATVAAAPTSSPSPASATPFSAAECDLLEHLAAQAAVSLENLDLHELDPAPGDDRRADRPAQPPPAPAGARRGAARRRAPASAGRRCSCSTSTTSSASTTPTATAGRRASCSGRSGAAARPVARRTTTPGATAARSWRSCSPATTLDGGAWPWRSASARRSQALGRPLPSRRRDVPRHRQPRRGHAPRLRPRPRNRSSNAADAAMYVAKRGGKNRAVVAPETAARGERFSRP